MVKDMRSHNYPKKISNDLLTPKEIADRHGWPVKRIRKLISERKLPFLVENAEGELGKRGARYWLPENAIDQYIQENMFMPKKALRGAAHEE